MQRYTIRLAEEADINALPGVERAAAQRFLPYVEQLEITTKLLEGLTPTRFLLRSQREQRLWVAIPSRIPNQSANQSANPQPVGFIVAKFLPDSCFVVELSVHPDHGRRGIGSALVEACCTAALSRGRQQVTLATFRYVAWSIPFYQRLGCRPLGHGYWSPDIEAIVQHEARYGFARKHRVVMMRPAKRPISLAKAFTSHPHHA